MRYFPILDELFASDTVIFLLIGLVAAFLFGIFVVKKPGIGILGSAIAYASCELLSNFVHSYMLEFILLFVGTFALGSVGGFIIAWIVSRVRSNSD